MSQATGCLALAELDGSGWPVMPSWGRRALGSCQLLRRNSGWWGRADPAPCPVAGLPLLSDVCCPERSPVPIGEHRLC